MKHPGVDDQALVPVMRALDDGLRRNPRLEMKDLDTRLADFAQEVPQEQIDQGRLLLQEGQKALTALDLAVAIKKLQDVGRGAVEGAAVRQEAGAGRRDDGARRRALRERRQARGQAHLRAAARVAHRVQGRPLEVSAGDPGDRRGRAQGGRAPEARLHRDPLAAAGGAGLRRRALHRPDPDVRRRADRRRALGDPEEGGVQEGGHAGAFVAQGAAARVDRARALHQVPPGRAGAGGRGEDARRADARRRAPTT